MRSLMQGQLVSTAKQGSGNKQSCLQTRGRCSNQNTTNPFLTPHPRARCASAPARPMARAGGECRIWPAATGKECAGGRAGGLEKANGRHVAVAGEGTAKAAPCLGSHAARNSTLRKPIVFPSSAVTRNSACRHESAGSSGARNNSDSCMLQGCPCLGGEAFAVMGLVVPASSEPR
jgi:hypothetical protein